MFSKTLTSAVLALATTQLVSAQTSTLCNPMEKNCPDDPALGGTISVDFTKGKSDFFTLAEGTTLSYDGSNGAVFSIKEEGNAPTITSNKYILFGKIDVTVKAAPGKGVVTSFVLQSDNLDEVDWEWIGSDTAQVQTNYFGKGDTSTYDRGAFHPVDHAQDNFVTYTIDWTKDYIRWYIGGVQVRELKYSDAKGGSRFPQTPMQIKLGTWVAGRKDAPTGTVQWAGGYTDFSNGAVYNGYYKSVVIQDYSNGVTGAKAYRWGEKSDGSYQSIKVLTSDGEANLPSSSSQSASSSKTASDSATKSGDKTTLSTSTVTRPGGLTQATDGSDSDTTASAEPSKTISTASVASTGTGSTVTNTGSSSSSTTSAPAKNGAFKQSYSAVLLGASLFAAYIAM